MIRESLTGRAKTLQLFPFTCAEALELPFENRWAIEAHHIKTEPRVKRKEFQKTLIKGGMPDIFATRNVAEIPSYWKSLIESYVYRDLLFSVTKNPKPSLALSILKAIAEILALGDAPTLSRILKKTGGTRTLVEKHVLGLEDLMIIQRISCLGASMAKDIFMPFDSALFLTLLELENPQHDVAIHTACIQICLIKEFLVAQQVTDLQQPLFYVESPSNRFVQLATQDKKGNYTFFQIFEEPIPHVYDLRFLESLTKKYPGKAFGLTSIETPTQVGEVTLLPWETLL